MNTELCLSKTLIRLGEEAAAAGLVAASCGNASLRLGPSSILITSSGSELGRLGESDLTKVSLAGETLSGPRPSCETEMHLEVFRVRPEARVVLHSHAPWSTLMACLRHPVKDLDFMVEVPLLVGRHAYVPFFPPGSRELAEEVGRAFLDVSVNVVQLCNHGQVSLGTSWREALHRLVLFERACWMALQGQELRRIGPDHGGRWAAGLRHD